MNITSPRSMKYEIYKDKQYKRLSRATIGKVKSRAGGGRKKAPDGPPMINASAALL